MNEEYYPIDDSDDDESVEYYAIRPNKTRIKKEIADVFAMAEEITQLSPTHISEFELPENIEKALLDAAKMGHNAARKRLLKYITAQLRKIDLEAVQEKLARLKIAVLTPSASIIRPNAGATNYWRIPALSS